MTMAFFIIPLVMTQDVAEGGFGWERSELWRVYLPGMVFGLVAIGPFCCVLERKYGKG